MIINTLFSPVTVGMKTADVLSAACSTVTMSRLPLVPLKTQLKMIALATESIRNSQNE